MTEHGGWCDPSKMKVHQMIPLYEFYSARSHGSHPPIVFDVLGSDRGPKARIQQKSPDSDEEEESVPDDLVTAGDSSYGDDEDIVKVLEAVEEDEDEDAEQVEVRKLDLIPSTWNDSDESRRMFLTHKMVKDKEYLDLVTTFFNTDFEVSLRSPRCLIAFEPASSRLTQGPIFTQPSTPSG
jgi:hypothetical protein